MPTTEQNRASYARHADRRRAGSREYYRGHREERLAYARAYREKNKAALKAKVDAYRVTHREELLAKGRAANARRQIERYGISVAEYESLSHAQGGVCMICKEPETRRTSTGKPGRLVVDHDHETGTHRGLLCHSCNVAIGHLNDDPDLIAAARDYLIAWKRARLTVAR